jgi:hypothetical protein
MKTLFLCLSAIFTMAAAAQPSGYTRGGAEKTSKDIKLLFTESFLFSKGRINLPGDKGEHKPAILEAIAESDKTITEFESKVEEFIKSKPVASVLKNSYISIEREASASSIAIETAAAALNDYRSLSAVSLLQELYLYRAYIKGAMKVYPEALSMEEKLEAIENAIQQHGSRENFMAKMEKNKLDYVKSIRMKNAVFSDPAIEKMVKTAYEKQWAADKVTVTKVNITGSWVIEKNVLDIPLNKEVPVNIAIKKADGTCAIATAYVRQEYEGGGKYGGAYMNMASPPITIPCENLTK